MDKRSLLSAVSETLRRTDRNEEPVLETDPMLQKIRKLLAKAENDATTPEEAELYTAKAAQLVAEYGIDQALLATDGEDRGGVKDKQVRLDAPYAADKADLLATVASRLRCRAIRVTERTPTSKEFSIHLFGHEADLMRTDLLFTSLLMQASTWMMVTPVPHSQHKAAFRRSWLAGFRLAVGRRLEEAERSAEQDAVGRETRAGSTALVLADRMDAVDQALGAAYPRLGTARPRNLSGGGLSDGWAAGQRADLGGRRVRGGTARALG